MRDFLRNNSLSITLFALFAAAMVGQVGSGWAELNQDLAAHGRAALGLLAYLHTGHFISAVFENWESEFLQMMVYVVLTAKLTQKGSPESKQPDRDHPVDAVVDRDKLSPDMPWPVRRGGLALKLYAHSLSMALGLLFLLSFWLHAAGSTRKANEDAVLHGKPLTTFADTLVSAAFWFESFQNWQSEFLSVGVLIVLGIYLRERGSPESKPVAAPHGSAGD